MKGLLAVLFIIGAAAAEPPAPYAPSGWRPSGPAFELPQRGQNPNYLPPVDPRTPALAPDADDVEVTVQGLPPRQEQQPIFQPSPVTGQQYVGPNFNADIHNLDQGLNQAQLQVQQQKAREFARQRQQNEARVYSTNTPPQFIPRTTLNPTQTAFTQRPAFRTSSTTPANDDLNEGETDEISSPAVSGKQRVSVEVSKQNIQEYPPELFLNPLAQLRLQPVQFGQSPLLVPGQSQKQTAGFDAQTHFAALPSIIAQQRLNQQRALLQQYPGNQAFLVTGQTSNRGFLIQSPQPLQSVGQLQPLVQPSPIQQNVLQPQVVNQIQPNQQPQPDDNDDERDDNQPRNPTQPQFAFQPQPEVIYQPQQPQLIYQPQAETVYQQPGQINQQQTENVYQHPGQFNQPQLVLQQAYPQPAQPQQQKAREFARQRQQNEARVSSTNTPPQFIPRTTLNPTQTAFTQRPEFRTSSTTPANDDLNEGETDEIGSPAVSGKQRVSVEVSKQNIQEYPPELFLNPLAQLRLQPVQVGQSPLLVPAQSQKQTAGFDAQTHFAALPSIIAQQQAQQRLNQQRALLQQYPGNQAFLVTGQTSNRGFLIQSPQPLQSVGQLQPLVQPSPIQQNVLQPQVANQIQPNQQPQPDDNDDERDDNQPRNPTQPQFAFQPQPEVIYQPQQPQLIYQQPEAAYQPQAETVYQQPGQINQQQIENVYQQPGQFNQPQLVLQQAYPQPAEPQLQPQYQPQADQPQIYQPQTSYQPQTYQPQVVFNQYQTPEQQYTQGQLVPIPAQNLDQYYQQQLQQQQQQQQLPQNQGQDALQSGFDVNQQGNSLDQNDKEADDENADGGVTATAVATAFGTRTQPRVFTTYGAPIPRAESAATTESPVEEVTTEEGPAIAEATAVARGARRKSAKLRTRRIRPDSPIFTLNRSGRLVLVTEQ